jgi:hypothetical protein
LSKSVADAIEYLNVEIQHPYFKNSEATVAFIRRIDALFDILNSRHPWGRDFKAPMRLENEEKWRPFLLDSVAFLLKCKGVGGRPLYLTPRKTPILGFVISIRSVIGIFVCFIRTNKLKYLLTYKLSQDHLEIFFSSVK